MSVVTIGLQSGREAEFGKITENKSKLAWNVATNSNGDTDFTIFNHAIGLGLPVIPYVSTHPIWGIQLCRNTTVAQDSNAPRHWTITSSYSSEPLKQSEEQAENPLDRPPVVKWASNQYRRALERDRNGHALVNSVGDYFDPPVEADAARWIVSIEKNVTGIPADIINYTDATNQNSFSIQGVGIGAEVAKLTEVSLSERKSEQVGDDTVYFYTFGYSLELRPETWKLKVLNQGYRYKTGSSIKQILDDSTPPRPVTTPKLLTSAGAVLSSPTTANAVFLDFDIYTARDFSILPGISEV